MNLRVTLLVIIFLYSISGFSQIYSPVKWTTEFQHIQDDQYMLSFTATIQDGWAVYSQFLESDEGPVATSINFGDPSVIELIGNGQESGHKKEGFDALFDMNVIKFTEEYRIDQKIIYKGSGSVTGYLNYMTCDETKCLPPTDVEFSFDLASKAEDNSGNNEEEDDAASLFGTVENLEEKSGTSSQLLEPVKWSARYIKDKDQVEFTADIEEGWHIYGQLIEGDGPIPTEFVVNGEKMVLQVNAPNAVEERDDFFDGILIKKIKKKAVYTYQVKNQKAIEGELTYMSCDKEKCTFPPPILITIDPVAQTVMLDGVTVLPDAATMSQLFPVPPINLEQPVVQCGDIETANVKTKSLWNIFLLGFAGGLLALLTPCVFPMIPLTVSFFTKGGTSKRKGMERAVLYGFFILLVYLLLSVPFHLLDSVNPGILNDISTNVWLNIGFFVIFVFFAFSFFGYYELTIPSNWTNKVSNAESVGGGIGIFFMALTLALVSFSCTGPILGSLLAGALTSEGGAFQLTAGMGGFGLALALPFALFAAFPSWLSNLPKSGGWLNTVKVVLGFLELAAAFKFLSNADMVKHWGLLKIEPFLAVWIIIFLGLAIYLFGKIKFPHDSPVKKLSFLRISTGALALAFAVYLGTGFIYDEDKGSFKSLTLLSGLAPPAGYSWIHPKECPNNLDCFKDLSEGVAYAKEVNKPIMIDFTGHACVNCRKMEEHVWPKDQINRKLQNDFVLISLYVDEKIALPEGEQTDRMRNYGQKWSAFQASYFNNNSQPYYVLLSPDGQLLNNPVGYTPDADQYAAFLECGLNAFEELNTTESLGMND